MMVPTQHLCSALRNGDVQQLELISLSQSQRPWDFDVGSAVDSNLVSLVMHSCDLDAVVSKPMTNAAWKLFQAIVKSNTRHNFLSQLAGFALQQLIHSVGHMCTDAIDRLGDLLNTAKFIAAQVVTLAKSAPEVCGSVGLDPDGRPVPLFASALWACHAVVANLRELASTKAQDAPVLQIHERDFSTSVSARVEAAIGLAVANTGMIAAHGIAKALRVMLAPASSAEGVAQAAADVNHAIAGFALAGVCYRAVESPQADMLEATLLWLPGIATVLRPISDSAIAVATGSRLLPATFFVDSPSYSHSRLGITDLGAAHRWWLVATRLVLLLPLSDSLPLLTAALACPDDTSLERVCSVWLSLLRMTQGSARWDAVAQVLRCVALTSTSESDPVARRTARVAARVLRAYLESAEPQSVPAWALSGLHPAVIPANASAATWNAVAAECPQYEGWCTARRVPDSVVAALCASTPQDPASALGVVAAALRTTAANRALAVCCAQLIAECNRRASDGDVDAVTRLLDAFEGHVDTAWEVLEVNEMAHALRSAIQSIFFSLRATLLARGAEAFAGWAQRTPVSIDDGIIANENLSTLVQHFVELRSAAELPFAAYAPAVSTTAAALPVRQCQKRHRAEARPAVCDAADCVESSTDLIAATQSSASDDVRCPPTVDASSAPADAAFCGASPEVVSPLQRSLAEACRVLSQALSLATAQSKIDPVPADALLLASQAEKLARQVTANLHARAPISIDSE